MGLDSLRSGRKHRDLYADCRIPIRENRVPFSETEVNVATIVLRTTVITNPETRPKERAEDNG